MGSKGESVQELQELLKACGYLSGKADGDFDSGTEKAVKQAQKDMGFAVDGVATKAFVEALRSRAN